MVSILRRLLCWCGWHDYRDAIALGDLVKVRLISGGCVERVWARVTAVWISDQTLDAVIDNYPLGEAWSYGAKVTVPVSYVLEKWGDRVIRCRFCGRTK